MSTVVDARGEACPRPVVLTKKALEQADEVTTIVDNDTAKENVSRLAVERFADRSQGREPYPSYFAGLEQRQVGYRETDPMRKLREGHLSSHQHQIQIYRYFHQFNSKYQVIVRMLWFYVSHKNHYV